MLEQPKKIPITDEMVVDAMRKLPPNVDPEKTATAEVVETDPDAIQVVLSDDQTKGDDADKWLIAKEAELKEQREGAQE